MHGCGGRANAVYGCRKPRKQAAFVRVLKAAKPAARLFAGGFSRTLQDVFKGVAERLQGEIPRLLRAVWECGVFERQKNGRFGVF